MLLWMLFLNAVVAEVAVGDKDVKTIGILAELKVVEIIGMGPVEIMESK